MHSEQTVPRFLDYHKHLPHYTDENTTKSLDIVKYCLPECYKTELTWSVNARSLQNFLSLRSSKSALWEIRNLSLKLYESLPQEHKFIFEDHVNQELEAKQ